MNFLNPNFLLKTALAQRLYHEVAAGLPIYDYHCHLSPADIATDRIHDNLYDIWLAGDHYKWRAMRWAGVDEGLISGNADPYDKYMAWATALPQLVGNPVHQWAHLELRRYFGIDLLLTPRTAHEIWTECQAKLPELSTWKILKKFQVVLVGTTDDPQSTLVHHRTIAESSLKTRVYPSFRPDRAVLIDGSNAYREYLVRLGQEAGVNICDLDSLQDSLRIIHARFHELGSRLSDHGLAHLPDCLADAAEARKVLSSALDRNAISKSQQDAFICYLMRYLAKLDRDAGWTQQLHLGARRNVSSRLLTVIGPDAGGDCIGDYSQGAGLCRFLDDLDRDDQLPRTVLYNNHPADNHLFATIAGVFQRGPQKGRIQWGSGWWFLDQRDGIRQQLQTLAQVGLLSTFIGMLTDSRSWMSFPRHEYFRRVLCDYLADEVEMGLIPDDWEGLQELVKGICFRNAQAYFQMEFEP
jgi:glucuronate isomerase